MESVTIGLDKSIADKLVEDFDKIHPSCVGHSRRMKLEIMLSIVLSSDFDNTATEIQKLQRELTRTETQMGISKHVGKDIDFMLEQSEYIGRLKEKISQLNTQH